jgi:hypothetical protein
MATNATWTIIFPDKKINKAGVSSYIIDDDAFWNDPKFSNIWAIQYGTSNTSEEVEYRDKTPHTSYADASLGDFNEFITRFDVAHLAQLQSNWDDDNLYNEDGSVSETEAEKITRLGARPTSYSS